MSVSQLTTEGDREFQDVGATQLKDCLQKSVCLKATMRNRTTNDHSNWVIPSLSCTWVTSGLIWFGLTDPSNCLQIWFFVHITAGYTGVSKCLRTCGMQYCHWFQCSGRRRREITSLPPVSSSEDTRVYDVLSPRGTLCPHSNLWWVNEAEL